MLAAPRLSRAQSIRSLRFVPQADVTTLDGVANTQLVVRNASLLVFDTLYGTDSKLVSKPQMCEGHQVSDDQKTWVFRLRTGLRFHDKEPVLARDAVASFKRWMARDPMGQMLKARMDAIEVLDDRTFQLRLNRPFSKMLYAIGKSGSPPLLIMPERLANIDPYKLVKDFVGSGPMRFRADEWLAGSRAVFERFDGYEPRQEPGDWLAGGKHMNLDRIEWITMPDSGTSASALQNGEVDWLENPISDLVSLLKQSRGVTVDVADPLGNIGTFAMNHLHPPFNDERVRQAMQMAISQEDYMQAVAGDDVTMWRTLPSFFTPGTPFYTEAGGERLKGPRQRDKAKALLAQAGYDGAPVVLLVAADVPAVKGQCDVTAELLRKLGMQVDYQSLDWGTVGTRRTSKAPPKQGGWNLFHTWSSGAGCVNPAGYKPLDASGDTAWFGWPKSDAVQNSIQAWFDASGMDAERHAMEEINRVSMDFVTYIPTGFFLSATAWRSNISGIVKSPFPVFWGVTKS
ncbi:MAG: ABC transporter substrate-binding protein [Acetobacteraceae bacterium]